MTDKELLLGHSDPEAISEGARVHAGKLAIKYAAETSVSSEESSLGSKKISEVSELIGEAFAIAEGSFADCEPSEDEVWTKTIDILTQKLANDPGGLVLASIFAANTLRSHGLDQASRRQLEFETITSVEEHVRLYALSDKLAPHIDLCVATGDEDKPFESVAETTKRHDDYIRLKSIGRLPEGANSDFILADMAYGTPKDTAYPLSRILTLLGAEAFLANIKLYPGGAEDFFGRITDLNTALLKHCDIIQKVNINTLAEYAINQYKDLTPAVSAEAIQRLLSELPDMAIKLMCSFRESYYSLEQLKAVFGIAKATGKALPELPKLSGITTEITIADAEWALDSGYTVTNLLSAAKRLDNENQGPCSSKGH